MIGNSALHQHTPSSAPIQENDQFQPSLELNKSRTLPVAAPFGDGIAGAAGAMGAGPGLDTTPVLPSTVYLEPPLKGVRVMVMHVKDTMKDGPLVGETILYQLHEHTAVLAQRGVQLGCDYTIAESGKDYWF